MVQCVAAIVKPSIIDGTTAERIAVRTAVLTTGATTDTVIRPTPTAIRRTPMAIRAYSYGYPYGGVGLGIGFGFGRWW